MYRDKVRTLDLATFSSTTPGGYCSRTLNARVGTIIALLVCGGLAALRRRVRPSTRAASRPRPCIALLVEMAGKSKITAPSCNRRHATMQPPARRARAMSRAPKHAEKVNRSYMYQALYVTTF